MMMQRTANEYAACERRICKRSDQPKINRITNNDAMKPEFLSSGFIFTASYLMNITNMIIHVFANSFIHIEPERFDLVP